MKTRIYRYSQLPTNTNEAFFTHNNEFMDKIRNILNYNLLYVDEHNSDDSIFVFLGYKENLDPHKYDGLNIRQVFMRENWDIYATYYYENWESRQGILIDSKTTDLLAKYGTSHCDLIHKYRVDNGITDPFDNSFYGIPVYNDFLDAVIETDTIDVNCTAEEYEKRYW